MKSRLCLPLALSECLGLNEPRTTAGQSGNVLLSAERSITPSIVIVGE